MDAREWIIHYLRAYDGSSKRAIENTASSIRHNYKKTSQAEEAARNALYWLLDEKYIMFVPFEQMNEFERRYYESDCCEIYRVLKSFDEIEYLTNKYNKSED